jgi:phosphoribosylformylglycinamidine (FGAM) synthase PurS component
MSATLPVKTSTYRIVISNKIPAERSRLYFVAGEDLTEAHVEKLCLEALTDPVTEQFQIASSQTGSSGASFLEVTLLPGVTDSAAENLVQTARVLNVPISKAATGSRYVFDETLDEAALKSLALERMNPRSVCRWRDLEQQ